MSKVYELKTAGVSPLTLELAKAFMRVSSTADDALIQVLIDATTELGQKYTAREFTNNTWTLYLDDFANRIVLSRDPVDSITTVKYLVSDVLTTVIDTTYYLKKLVQCSEILLQEDQEWPTNIDAREQAIQIEFVTKSYYCENEILQALKMHVSFLYANRGDCSCDLSSAKKSGATMIYDQFRISRV